MKQFLEVYFCEAERAKRARQSQHRGFKAHSQIEAKNERSERRKAVLCTPKKRGSIWQSALNLNRGQRGVYTPPTCK